MIDDYRRDIKMTVPALAKYVHVLRLVACSVAARLDFPYDFINDIALAVDEAFSHLLSARLQPTTLTMRITPSAGGVEIGAFADFSAPVWPPDGAQESLTWKVVQGLTENARFDRAEEGPGFIFEKRTASP